MYDNTLSAVPTNCTNELDGECDNTTTGNVIAAGTVVNAIQLRSSTNTFTANDSFFFDTTVYAVPPSYTIYKLLNLTPLTTISSYVNIPSWAKRITINFTDVSTNGVGAPYIRLGGPTNSIDVTTLSGATWGSSNTSTQVQWYNAGIYLTNSPSTWTATLTTRGRCVIEKVGVVAGQAYYSVTLNTTHPSNINFGAGAYNILSNIGVVQLSAVSGIYDAGDWSLWIE